MEALAERVIAAYLTRGGKVFIVPQYGRAAPDAGGDWACPDFVALDFDRREVVVVAVAAKADLTSIVEKAKDRETQWFAPLRARLKADGVIHEPWPVRFLGFVPRGSLDQARRSIPPAPDMAFAAIEDASFSWEYWDTRVGGGLPR